MMERPHGLWRVAVYEEQGPPEKVSIIEAPKWNNSGTSPTADQVVSARLDSA